jgi:hypothetical protein
MNVKDKNTLIVYLLLISGIVFNTYSNLTTVRKNNINRATSLGLGSQLIKGIVPLNYKIAVTEMNTFGFFTDNEIIDLWGYSNIGIAKSGVCSERRVRNSGDTFLEYSPELFWFRTSRKDSIHGKSWSHLYDSTRREFFTLINLGKYYNQLGDMTKVTLDYTPVFIDHKLGKGFISFYLVRNDVVNEFLSRFSESGSRITKSSYDHVRNTEAYESTILKQLKCM